MKKIIAIMLTLSVSAGISPAYAADSVTTDDVRSAASVTSIVNSTEDIKMFGELKHDPNILPENVFLAYFMSYTEKTDEGYTNKKAFDGADAHTAKISDAIFTNRADGWYTEYIYRSSNDDYYGGLSFYNPGTDSAYISSYECEKFNSMRLFFSASDLASVINENNLGKPEKIMYMMLDDDESINNVTGSGGAVIICEKNKEYAVLNPKYTDDELSDYTLLDSEAFIEAMQGDLTKAHDVFYNKFSVSKAPSFSDISGDSAVTLLSRLGIINGYEDGSFGADKNITRAEAAKMTALFSMNIKSFDVYENLSGDVIGCDFADVPIGFWARKYIRFGALRGYISGSDKVGETAVTGSVKFSIDSEPYEQEPDERYIDIYNFYPEKNVTEQELAKMLVCIADAFGETMAQAEGGWPDGYVSVAKRLGICETASSEPATRLTASHMIKNAFDAYVTMETDDYAEYVFDSAVSGEMRFTKGIYYNLQTAAETKYVKLKGQISKELRDNEFLFVAGEDIDTPYFNADKNSELIILSKYGDMGSVVGKECEVYCALDNGNLIAVMAE